MRITIEPTSRIVTVVGKNGAEIPARVWQGRTGNGLEVAVLVTRVCADRDDDLTELELTLDSMDPPGRIAAQAIPNRLIL